MPFSARTYSTRLRWWQPQHSGEGKDQWALDDLYLNADSKPDNLEAMQQVIFQGIFMLYIFLFI